MTDLAEQVRIEDPDFYTGDPYPVLARLRKEAPIFYYEPLETWVLTKYEDIRHVSRAPELFTSTSGTLLNDVRYGNVLNSFFPADAALISTTDPPLHREVRRTITPPFVPSATAHMEDEIRACAVALLDRLEPGEPVDWLELVAVPFPLQVIALLFGLPLDRIGDLRAWSDEMVKFGTPLSREELAQIAADLAPMREYFTEQFERKRAEPGEDLLTSLLDAEMGGQKLSQANLQTLATGVIVAGNETMRNLLAGTICSLAAHPAQMALLKRDRSLIVNATEEFLRWVSPITGFVRRVTQDTELGGQKLLKGQFVYMMYMAGNRDEEVFEIPDELNVARPRDPMHVSLGWGPHVCLGAPLARLESRVLLEELLDRFSEVELVGAPKRLPSVMQTAWTDIQVRFAV